jgi:hypothetical protein
MVRLLAAAAVACVAACVTERPEARGGAAVQRRSARVIEPCVVSGCSGQICAREPLFSTCEWRPEYACFADATCAPQASGGCGWTMTDALRACLEAAGKEAP